MFSLLIFSNLFCQRISALIFKAKFQKFESTFERKYQISVSQRFYKNSQCSSYELNFTKAIAEATFYNWKKLNKGSKIYFILSLKKEWTKVQKLCTNFVFYFNLLIVSKNSEKWRNKFTNFALFAAVKQIHSPHYTRYFKLNFGTLYR